MAMIYSKKWAANKRKIHNSSTVRRRVHHLIWWTTRTLTLKCLNISWGISEALCMTHPRSNTLISIHPLTENHVRLPKPTGGSSWTRLSLRQSLTTTMKACRRITLKTLNSPSLLTWSSSWRSAVPMLTTSSKNLWRHIVTWRMQRRRSNKLETMEKMIFHFFSSRPLGVLNS